MAKSTKPKKQSPSQKKANPSTEPYEAAAEHQDRLEAEPVPEPVDDAPFDEGVVELEAEEVAAFDDKQLQKFDVAEAWVEETKAKALALKVAGVDDLEGYNAAKEMLAVIVTKRNDVERMRTKLNKSALDWQRRVNGEAKRLTALLQPIESHLREQKAVVDNERARLAKEAEEKAEAAYLSRVSEMAAIGFMVREGALVHTETGEVMDLGMLRGMDDETFRFEHDRLSADARRRADIKREENERMERERKELEQQRQEFEKERQELERLRAEAEELKRLKLKAERERRQDTLTMNGFVFEAGEFVYKAVDGSCFASDFATILNPELTDAETFSAEWNRIRLALDEFKVEAGERKAENERLQERRRSRVDTVLELADLIPTRDKYAVFVNFFNNLRENLNPNKSLDLESDDDFLKWVREYGDRLLSEKIEHEAAIALELKEAAEKQKELERQQQELEKAKREEELAQMSDAELLLLYVGEVKAVTVPEIKTAKYKRFITQIQNSIGDAETQCKVGKAKPAKAS